MLTVRMIQYWNDYHKKELMGQFKNLRGLEDWIFSQMRVDYSSEHGRNLLSFLKCDTESGIYRISVRPESGGFVYGIHLMIEDMRLGIVFPDGTNPTFRFAEDGAESKGDSGSYERDIGRCGGKCATCHCSE